MFRKSSLARFGSAIALSLTLLCSLGSAQAPLDFLFVPDALYDSGGYSDAIAVGDLNHDGRPDLIVLNCGVGPACQSTGSVGVLLGNGDGTFRSATMYFSGGTIPTAIALADVNHDGNLDVLVANNSGLTEFGADALGVLLGNGDGTLRSVTTFDTGTSGLRSMAVGDLNGDGNADVVVGPISGRVVLPSGYAVLLGRSDGTFQPPLISAVGQIPPWEVALGDINGDGKLDLITAGACLGGVPCNATVSAQLGNGDGTFQPPATSFPASTFISLVALADLNGDGKSDLVVADRNYTTIDVRISLGDGTFQAPSSYTLKTRYANYGSAISLTTGNVSGDGKADVLLGIQGVGVLLGNGQGGLQPITIYNPAFAVEFMAVGIGDVNGDGKPDLAFTRGDAVGVLLNNEGAPPTTTSLSSNINPITVKQPVTYKAKVMSNSGGAVNGNVVFMDAGSTIGEAPLINNAATLTVTYDAVFPHTITAAYAGTLHTAAASISNTITENVLPNSTTTLLTSSLNPSIYGQRVTFTATVKTTGVPATGTVVLTWGTLPLTYNIGSAMLNSAGVATLTKSNLNADAYPLTAHYKGDANYLQSTSNVVDQVVTQTTSKTTLSSSLNPSTFGQAVTFTAKITSPTVLPTGPVTFTVGKTILGTVQLRGGKATLTISSLPVGSTKVTATYYGNSNIAKSSASVTQTVR